MNPLHPDHTALATLEQAPPAPGTRNATLQRAALALGRSGHDNDTLVRRLEEAGSRWGYLPEGNLYRRYKLLVGLVHHVRSRGIDTTGTWLAVAEDGKVLRRERTLDQALGWMGRYTQAPVLATGECPGCPSALFVSYAHADGGVEVLLLVHSSDASCHRLEGVDAPRYPHPAQEFSRA